MKFSLTIIFFLLLAFSCPFQISSSNYQVDGKFHHLLRYNVQNETNFTLTQDHPSITIFTPPISGQTYEVNFTVNLLEGDLLFEYSSIYPQDAPCCDLGGSNIGSHSYSIQLKQYLKFTIPMTYLQNGSTVLTSNYTIGSYNIDNVRQITVQSDNEYVGIFVLWLFQLLPLFFIVAVVSSVLLYFKKSH